MQEFIYKESKYIKPKDLKDFEDLMLSFEYMPEDIEDEEEFNIVFHYLLHLTENFPDFLQPYEYALGMIRLLEPDKELEELEADLENRWIGACERVAESEDIFNKTVEWGWLENRPIIRGLFQKANKLWELGEIKDAHDLFSKIYKTNENDNIGARYSVKATAEGMSYEEFEEKFTTEDGNSYKVPELWEWYGEES